MIRKESHKKILNEIEDLLNIPVMEKLLVHKLEELKAALGEDISAYHSISQKLQPSDSKLKGREFRLTRQGKSLWVPTLASPLQPWESLPQLFPRELIQYITEYPFEQNVIVSKVGLTLPKLENRAFDLFFEKIQDNLITGIISERNSIPKDKAMFESLHGDWVDVKELGELFDYLLSDKKFYHFALRQFKLVWQPLLKLQHNKTS